MLITRKQPSWIPPGANYAFDFLQSRFYGGNMTLKANAADPTSLGNDNGAYGTLSAINPYTPQRNGILYQGKPIQNRITDLGLFAERAATNFCLYCRDLTITQSLTVTVLTGTFQNNETVTATVGGAGAYILSYSTATVFAIRNGTGTFTGTLTGGTSGATATISASVSIWTQTSVMAALNQAGADASVSTATLLTAGASPCTILQSITATSNTVTFSAYIKRITGTGTVKITVDGGSTYTDVTALINSAGYSWVQLSAIQTVTNPNCGIQLGTSGDQVAVDFCQMERCNTVGLKATTPLITTSATSSRANAPIFFGLSNPAGAGQRIVTNIFSVGAWAMIMSFNGDGTLAGTPAGGPAILASDMANPATLLGGNGCVLGIGAAHPTVNSGNNGRGNWNIAGISCSGQGVTYCLNGGVVSAVNTGNPPSLNPGATHFNIGNNGSGTFDFTLNGSIGGMAIWASELSQAQLSEYTNLTSGFGYFVPH